MTSAVSATLSSTAPNSRNSSLHRVQHVGERRDEQRAAVDRQRGHAEQRRKAGSPPAPSPIVALPSFRPSSVKTGCTIIGAASRCSQKATSARRVSARAVGRVPPHGEQEHADAKQQHEAEDEVLRAARHSARARRRARPTAIAGDRGGAGGDGDRDPEAAPVQPGRGGGDRCRRGAENAAEQR